MLADYRNISIDSEERRMRLNNQLILRALEASQVRMYETIASVFNHCNDNVMGLTQSVVESLRQMLNQVLTEASRAPPSNVSMRLPVATLNQVMRSLNNINDVLRYTHTFCFCVAHT